MTHNPPEIDLYCERLSAFWFDEPLGLLSNFGFLVAAAVLARQPHNGARAWFLIALLTAIGIGSGLFHAFATRATLLMDVIPIQLFILTAIWILFRTHLRWHSLAVVALCVGCILVSSRMPSNVLHGSLGYLPAWILLVSAALLHPTGAPRQYLVHASALFPVSLTFRTLDVPLCDGWPVGTHFLWHLGNALVLYWIIRAVQSHAASVGSTARTGYTQGATRM